MSGTNRWINIRYRFVLFPGHQRRERVLSVHSERSGQISSTREYANQERALTWVPGASVPLMARRKSAVSRDDNALHKRGFGKCYSRDRSVLLANTYFEGAAFPVFLRNEINTCEQWVQSGKPIQRTQSD